MRASAHASHSAATMIHLLSNINYASRMSGKNRTEMLTRARAHAHNKHANVRIPLDQIIANASFCFTQLLKIGFVCVARSFPFHTKISHALRGSRAKKISFHKIKWVNIMRNPLIHCFFPIASTHTHTYARPRNPHIFTDFRNFITKWIMRSPTKTHTHTHSASFSLVHT